MLYIPHIRHFERFISYTTVSFRPAGQETLQHIRAVERKTKGNWRVIQWPPAAAAAAEREPERAASLWMWQRWSMRETSRVQAASICGVVWGNNEEILWKTGLWDKWPSQSSCYSTNHWLKPCKLYCLANILHEKVRMSLKLAQPFPAENRQDVSWTSLDKPRTMC